jgi:hypothetical protein
MDLSAKCPFCQGDPSTQLLDPVETEELGKVNLLICGKCGLVYVPARPPFVKLRAPLRLD